jgi:preprotein translocase subunit SecD
VTGRRGVSFRLNNKDGDAFEEYAKVHPGEYVAVVLDGVVLATLPIAEQVANGHFAFTGDYTEAETHVLVMSLYKGPLRFPLQKLRDVEVPAP